MNCLWDLEEEREADVVDLEPSLHETHALRLLELGIRSGERICCLKKVPFGGPRVYRVGQSVFSIAKDVASKVRVGPECQNVL